MIQRNNIILPPLQPPKIPHQDRGNRPQENTIRAHKIQKARRARQNLPGYQCPRHHRTNQLAPPDIHISGEQRAEIIGRAQAVRRDIDPQRREHESRAREEFARAVRPLADQIGRVPVQLAAVVGLSRGGAGDADEGDEGEYYGEEGHVEPLPLHAGFAVAREVGHVHREGGVVADYRREAGEPGVGVGGAGDGGGGGGGEEGAACAAGGAEGPDEHGDEGDGDEDRFGHEEVAQVVGVHVKEGDLEEPDCVGRGGGISVAIPTALVWSERRLRKTHTRKRTPSAHS